MKSTRPTGFLNVDLEITSRTSLGLLADELGKATHILHSGPATGSGHLLCVETSRSANTPDATARHLCKTIEQLSPAGRELWNRASQRVFNIGYELPPGQRSIEMILQPETLTRIVALGATVAFTCYRAVDDGPTGDSENDSGTAT